MWLFRLAWSAGAVARAAPLPRARRAPGAHGGRAQDLRAVALPRCGLANRNYVKMMQKYVKITSKYVKNTGRLARNSV